MPADQISLNAAGLGVICETFLCKRQRPHSLRMWPLFKAGDDLLSHTLSRAVQSALRGLTSVFGMGTGGSPAVRSPTKSVVSPQLVRARADAFADPNKLSKSLRT